MVTDAMGMAGGRTGEPPSLVFRYFDSFREFTAAKGEEGEIPEKMKTAPMVPLLQAASLTMPQPTIYHEAPAPSKHYLLSGIPHPPYLPIRREYLFYRSTV